MSEIGTEESASGQTAWVLPAWAIGVPAVLLIGFLALLGRAGVGIQILGLPLGAYLTPLPSVLVVGLIATARGRMLLRSLDRSQRRVAVAVAVAVAVGLLRAAAQGMPTLLRFQDMAYLLHLPWIVVGMAAMRALPSDEERSRVLRWLAWNLTIVLTLHWARGLIAPVEWLFEQIVGGLEGFSDKPTYLTKDGDRALFSVALAAIAVGLSGGRGGQSFGLVTIAGLLLGTQVADFFLGGSRGALLGVLLGGTILMAQGLSRTVHRILIGATALSFVLSSAVVFAAAPAQVDPSHISSPESSLLIKERYEIVAGRRALTATAEQLRVEDGQFARPSEVSWRIAIWTDVIDEWNASWANRLFGIGFGTDIGAMTVPGRQGFDGLNRGVHGITFTVIARQGTLGLAALLGVLLALIVGLIGSGPMGVPILVTALVIGSFDVFLEGVQAPIVLWGVIGMIATGVLRAGRLVRPR